MVARKALQSSQSDLEILILSPSPLSAGVTGMHDHVLCVPGLQVCIAMSCVCWGYRYALPCPVCVVLRL